MYVEGGWGVPCREMTDEDKLLEGWKQTYQLEIILITNVCKALNPSVIQIMKLSLKQRMC